MQLNKDGELKWFRLFGHFSLISVLLIGTLSAESFKDFKRVQAEAFTEYKDKRDNGFHNYLKKQFREYKAQVSPSLYAEPKPKNITPAHVAELEKVGPRVNVKMKPIVEEEIKKAKIAIVSDKKPDISFDFFGSELGFFVEKSLRNAKFSPTNQEGISNFFNMAARSEYATLVSALLNIKESMRLNDWALYLLVRKLSQELYENENEAKLFSWFMFNKLGYDVRVGIAQREITLMHLSEKNIYATPNYTFANKKFYALSHYAKRKIGRLYSYEKSYPEATKALDLRLSELPRFNSRVESKILKFENDKKVFTTRYSYNKNLIDFMATYPQADYETYFNAPVDAMSYVQIKRDIKKHIDGMKASEALNFVLNFVQNAFVYEVDDKQFGREKVMFAQETLYFDKSDCEDRAVLFSYLVKELFGYSVIGVKYKDHMATALYIPLKGDTVKTDKKKYVIADPTYINASVGQSMPKYKSIRPESFVKVNIN